MISVKQIIVKSTTPSILSRCDVIGNIQHLPIRISDHQSSSKCSTSHDMQDFCLKFCMVDPNDIMNEVYNEKKYSSTVIMLSKILVFVTVHPIVLFKFLFAVFLPCFEVSNGSQETYKLFPFYKKCFKKISPSCSFSK